jgi:hypothetical protein
MSSSFPSGMSAGIVLGPLPPAVPPPTPPCSLVVGAPPAPPALPWPPWPFSSPPEPPAPPEIQGRLASRAVARGIAARAAVAIFARGRLLRRPGARACRLGLARSFRPPRLRTVASKVPCFIEPTPDLLLRPNRAVASAGRGAWRAARGAIAAGRSRLRPVAAGAIRSADAACRAAAAGRATGNAARLA